MSQPELEAYLHNHIPLSRAMGVRVIDIGGDRVVLGAPIKPNINHRETVFGGSASAVAILAAWALLHLRLSAAGRESRLVIQHNSMDYIAPIAGDFTATAELKDEADWDGFLRMIDRKGRGRIHAVATLATDGPPLARLEGAFVALPR